jgi:hypothetical protein
MPDVQKKLELDPPLPQFYESARDELIQRLALRDQTMIAYIATAGAYFGFIVAPAEGASSAAGQPATQLALMMALPVISLVFTYIITQHHVMIGRIGVYTRSVYPDSDSHWDHHYVNWEDKRYLSARTVSQGLLLAPAKCLRRR